MTEVKPTRVPQAVQPLRKELYAQIFAPKEPTRDELYEQIFGDRNKREPGRLFLRL